MEFIRTLIYTVWFLGFWYFTKGEYVDTSRNYTAMYGPIYGLPSQTKPYSQPYRNIQAPPNENLGLSKLEFENAEIRRENKEIRSKLAELLERVAHLEAKEKARDSDHTNKTMDKCGGMAEELASLRELLAQTRQTCSQIAKMHSGTSKPKKKGGKQIAYTKVTSMSAAPSPTPKSSLTYKPEEQFETRPLFPFAPLEFHQRILPSISDKPTDHGGLDPVQFKEDYVFYDSFDDINWRNQWKTLGKGFLSFEWDPLSHALKAEHPGIYYIGAKLPSPLSLKAYPRSILQLWMMVPPRNSLPCTNETGQFNLATYLYDCRDNGTPRIMVQMGANICKGNIYYKLMDPLGGVGLFPIKLEPLNFFGVDPNKEHSVTISQVVDHFGGFQLWINGISISSQNFTFPSSSSDPSLDSTYKTYDWGVCSIGLKFNITKPGGTFYFDDILLTTKEAFAHQIRTIKNTID